MNVMIFAAGEGKRLRPLSNQVPKPLIKIGTKTLLDIALDTASKINPDSIVINVFHLKDQITTFLDKHPMQDKIVCIEEPFLLGTGGGLINASEHLGAEPILILNSDLICDFDISQLNLEVEYAHLIGVPNPSHNNKGDFSIQGSYAEVLDSHNQFTFAGISIINPNIFSNHKNSELPLDLWKDLLLPLINQRKISAEIYDGLWCDVGTEDRLKLARDLLKEEN